MPSQPAPGHPTSSRKLTDLASLNFLPGEWEVLTGLPAQVVIAATAVADGEFSLHDHGVRELTPRVHDARQTVAEGLAGLDAIAAGRAFDSDLVRAVVAAIYAENDGRSTGDGRSHLAAFDGVDPIRQARAAAPAAHDHRRPAEVLASCRSVTAVLSARADPADSAAYRQWLQSIAARVCEAASSGELLGLGGDLLSDAEREFLDELGSALGLT
jgi:hypothetical protein